MAPTSARIALAAFVTAGLAGCGSTGAPITNETTPPTLTLNIGDTHNAANNVTGAPMAVIPKNPKKMAVDDGVNLDPMLNGNYVYTFAMWAHDLGGIAKFGYTSQFLSFGACNPESDYGSGTSFDQPVVAVPPNPDKSIPTDQLGLIVATAANERQAECGNTPGPDIAGVYILTATATNYSNLTTTATWYVNIGTQQTIPTQPSDK